MGKIRDCVTASGGGGRMYFSPSGLNEWILSNVLPRRPWVDDWRYLLNIVVSIWANVKFMSGIVIWWRANGMVARIVYVNAEL